MTKTFASYDAVTEHIQDAILDRIPGAKLGVSAQSVSRYVEVEDGRRVRISDHDATASCGGNIVYEIDIRGFWLEEVYDDFNEFDGVTTEHEYKIDEAIEAAVEALTK